MKNSCYLYYLTFDTTNYQSQKPLKTNDKLVCVACASAKLL